MNLVFMGTPDFAVPSLERLIDSRHNVKLVVTAPDKERGRGRKVTPTPIKEVALSNNIEVVTPSDLTDDSFLNLLKEINADLFVVVAFRILPAKVFTIPAAGTINLHGSLLPKYRGAAPIQWALINGDTETGLTTFFIDEKVDTGNIIMQQKVRIEENDDYGSLYNKMKIEGAELLLKTVDLIESGNYTLQKQDPEHVTMAPKITKELCRIDWNLPAKKIHNLIRGLSPQPGAFFVLNDKAYKVYKSAVVKEPILKPAEILQTKNEIFIGTGEGTLQIIRIKPEGRKTMTSEEFLRGYSLI
ncbi:methionyl-tRNA formyltransferase [Melioribacter roseus P3M-2]|uniref:Methionyl-tRNA formyltransferase n=1 Tax=Melioribacter roseus (strain DSM 23840 / JCM 17771 / VKM B-2668 / P3M-2) TaxID=1191523 RepID=I7A364_MELRP|nr:methionyl-tRNA formyltransferase [Melioribacter roseus]AFN75653.1 methionyl-tRNA formyltransferase [Melioribacter roseus P3M-2]